MRTDLLGRFPSLRPVNSPLAAYNIVPISFTLKIDIKLFFSTEQWHWLKLSEKIKLIIDQSLCNCKMFIPEKYVLDSTRLVRNKVRVRWYTTGTRSSRNDASTAYIWVYYTRTIRIGIQYAVHARRETNPIGPYTVARRKCVVVGGGGGDGGRHTGATGVVDGGTRGPRRISAPTVVRPT